MEEVVGLGTSCFDFGHLNSPFLLFLILKRLFTVHIPSQLLSWRIRLLPPTIDMVLEPGLESDRFLDLVDQPASISSLMAVSRRWIGTSRGP